MASDRPTDKDLQEKTNARKEQVYIKWISR